MENNDIRNYLEEIYGKAESNYKNSILKNYDSIDPKIREYLELIVSSVEDFLGVLNVTVTSLTYKSLNPNQDIRNHQAQLEKGYSGRSFDTRYIAPFLKSKGLKSMKESGWLTRSLEQASPYTLDYRGKIRDLNVKEAFLKTLHHVEEENGNSLLMLEYLLLLLIKQREDSKVEIEHISNPDLQISKILEMLSIHFEQATSNGRARLPVLAIHSIYQLLVNELERYDEKELQELSSHTSADLRHGDIGDVQVNYADGTPFEAVEVKYGIKITESLIIDAYSKIKQTKAKRYYMLSTVESSKKELEEIIAKIKDEHGCQIIVNGLLKTIEYYLRLISNPELFVNIYTDLVTSDKVIKTEHKVLWKKLLQNL